MSASIPELIQQYISTWNETDATRRRAAISALYTDDCSYVDPLASLQGPDAIDGFLAAMQKQYPGVIITLGGKVDAHHDQARFAWHAMAPGLTEPVASGFDVAVFADGRIRQVLGFLDKMPG